MIHSAAHKVLGPLGCVAVCVVQTGCLERIITVTSEPPGAVVELNGTDVGTTPMQTEFTYFGEYDVRLRHDGYEPIHTGATARAPLYEYPPIDLIAAVLPFTFQTNVKWHYVLQPDETTIDATIDRARKFRTESNEQN
ncbi:MAG: PEGA domain-containing protein [Phycisphaeraceae bacterium]|nr:PEGA domain-containing protein [Phycisphaerales bacterium]MCB9859961.1 PEGA domain-containing protein [Phycisphaeraceae bacterium]